MGSAAPGPPLGSDDRIIREFDALWNVGVPSLDEFWSGLGPGRPLTLLTALIKIDMMRRFERGERPSAAGYIGRFHQLVGDGARAVSIIYEEFCLLEENGASPDSWEFCELYEPWRDSLASQLAYHRKLSQVAGTSIPAVRYPTPGDRFASFLLRSILGRGGAAQVYLATDEDLGGRRVALKITASVGREPSILANLDHRGIVPILTVAESAETGLRGICMPYRPGETLEGLIRRLRLGPRPRKAKAIWDALRPIAGGPEDDLDSERSGWQGFPIRGTYHEAVAFIGLALANAMAYLHARNVLHRDIKPANILLAYREGPQLLDFNLAYDPNQPEHAQAALKGGTLPYMAPEQLAAFLDPSLWDSIQSPADIYGLGLVLKELATGLAPETPDRRLSLPRAIQALLDRRSRPNVPLHQLNPSIPPALESIIARCLAFEPADRYLKADEMAEDLRLFLIRKPLRRASNTSLMERASNFVYRNRIAGLILISLAALSPFVLAIQKPPATVIVAEPPRPIEKSREFLDAVQDYESKKPGLWERARDAFARLEAAHEGSAWPTLYLGLTLEKLKQDERANRKLVDVLLCHDVEPAIRSALSKNPCSATLRTLLGGWLNELKRYEEARPHLRVALEVQPNRLGALMAFAETERRTLHNREAIEYLLRAIKIGDAKPCTRDLADQLYGLRSVLITLSASQADLEIDRGATPEERLKGRPFLEKIAPALDWIEKYWDGGGTMGDPRQRAFMVPHYRGVVASGRGVFQADRGENSDAARLFDRALVEFRELQTLISEDDKGGRLGEAIDKLIAQVEARSRAFLKQPARPHASQ